MPAFVIEVLVIIAGNNNNNFTLNLFCFKVIRDFPQVASPIFFKDFCQLTTYRAQPVRAEVLNEFPERLNQSQR